MSPIEGIVRAGKIEVCAGSLPPEGSRVWIVVAQNDEGSQAPTPWGVDPADRLEELALDAGPPDFATEHDHYIYGTPKRK